MRVKWWWCGRRLDHASGLEPQAARGRCLLGWLVKAPWLNPLVKAPWLKPLVTLLSPAQPDKATRRPITRIPSAARSLHISLAVVRQSIARGFSSNRQSSVPHETATKDVNFSLRPHRPHATPPFHDAALTGTQPRLREQFRRTVLPSLLKIIHHGELSAKQSTSTRLRGRSGFKHCLHNG